MCELFIRNTQSSEAIINHVMKNSPVQEVGNAGPERASVPIVAIGLLVVIFRDLGQKLPCDVLELIVFALQLFREDNIA